MTPTYKLSLLQVKSHRLLRVNIAKLLTKYQLSLSEWTILGNLHDRGGIRLADIAKMLDVEPPLVTGLVEGLEKKDLLTHQSDPFDKRAKRIALTKKAKLLVPKAEKDLQKKVRMLLKNVLEKDLQNYVHVLVQIVSELSEKTEA